MSRSMLLSILDQAMVSGVSFAIMICLVAVTNPAAVGHYAIYAAALLMAVGLHSALIVTPYNVLSPGRPEEAARVLAGAIDAADVVARFAIGALAAVLAGVLDGWSMAPLAFALTVATLWREAIRSRAITAERMDLCLRVDGLALGSALLAAIGLSLILPPVTAVLAALAIGNALCVAVHYAEGGALVPDRAALAGYATIWPVARFGVSGATATEIQDRGYVFVIAALRDEAAVGVLQAGRIMTAPVTLSATAWGRIARTRMARAIAEGNDAGARAILAKGLVALAIVAAACFAVLWLVWPLVERWILGDRYPGIGAIVAVWALYACLTIQSTAVSFYFQAAERFRELSGASWATAIAAISLVFLLALDVPLAIAAWAMVVGEAIGLGWMAWMMRQRERVSSR